jgi:hypothetical protein
MRGLATNRGTPPAEIEPYVRQVLITVGKEYQIHAVAVFEGIVIFQVIDDHWHPCWWPAWLLEVTDCSIPPGWICNVFHGQPAMVLGPEFIARDQQSYSGMVELDAEQVERFWSSLDATTRLLASKALRRPCGQECVDWAVSMLEQGFDGRYLGILAGLTPPFNPFDLADLRDRALKELGISDTPAG